VKGLPLEVYRFGTGPDERMIVAGMHGGNEYNTVQLAEQLMAYLGKHPEIVPTDGTLYILHDLNPDGVARALNYLGRANANGVDLNRNWPANWQADWPRSGCWTTTYVTGGSAAASEPETKALMSFIQNHHLSALINYHSAALGIFPGGIPISQASKRLAQAVADVTTYKYPPVNTGCMYTGGMVDWTANQGIASLDIELTNHTDTDFEMNLKVLDVFLNWKP
jgi:predicted deacylase